MVAAMLSLTACKSHYTLGSIERTRLLIDGRYDAHPDAAAAAFLAPYKHVVDSIMGPIVGEVATDMVADRPESKLSNLLADILVWAAKDYGEQPVLAIYNVGGIRSSLSKGKVTFGDILEVAPFENKICFLTLTGQQLMEVFTQIARRGGEGVSHGVQLVITHDGKLVSAQLNGSTIDPSANYRITTIDYLAQGNDQLDALKKGTNLNSPQEEINDTRFIIVNYFKEHMAKGQKVDAQVEGRIRFTP